MARPLIRVRSTSPDPRDAKVVYVDPMGTEHQLPVTSFRLTGAWNERLQISLEVPDGALDVVADLTEVEVTSPLSELAGPGEPERAARWDMAGGLPARGTVDPTAAEPEEG
jgi:hypothetical protein